MNNREQDAAPGFAPSDPTDNRQRLEWKTKYPEEAQQRICKEAIYLATHLLAAPLLMLILWLGAPKKFLSLSDSQYQAILKYGLAWLSGELGGTLFDIKWLYHTVAKQMWHADRLLWRLFTPHISGGLAFAIIALISSGMFRILDRSAAESPSSVVAVAFLVGYFSDSAVAKLSEISETLFGVTRGQGARLRHENDSSPT